MDDRPRAPVVRGAEPRERPSLLFAPGAGTAPTATPALAESLADLNLDQVIRDITAPLDADELPGLFAATRPDASTVLHRHEVFRDLAQPSVLQAVRGFVAGMDAVARLLRAAAESGATYRWHAHRWIVDAMDLYCSSVSSLVEQLGVLRI